MDKVKIACPGCGKAFAVDASFIGKNVCCNACGRRFTLSQADDSSVSATATITVACPSCQRKFKVDEKHLGRGAKCTKCGTKFTIESTNREKSGTKNNQLDAIDELSTAGRHFSTEKDVPAEWYIGDIILDLYEVTGVLGEGGMGKVYKVHHRGWNMDLAVKCTKPDYFKTDQQKENFVAECETWIKLGLHPHIVSCYYVRTLGGIPRVFAECIDGGNLKQWIESGKLYEGGLEKALERILDIAIQFAWGLHYAHEHEEKLVHQDVKPANVMMTSDGIAKVTDFGLAKARPEVSVGDQKNFILVSSGGMTPAYCSPEQANKEKLSQATDIWSWGLSILEMFTGDVTWMSGVAALQALESYLETGDGDGFIPKMPDTLAGLLYQCFDPNPDERPKSMAEVAKVLKETSWETTRKEYARKNPRLTELLADGLNNQGISLLDLDLKDLAESKFAEALEADPHHPESTYNRGLLQWRSGRLTDDKLLTQMEELAKSHSATSQDEYLLSLVHMERGDFESAVRVLESVEHEHFSTSDIKRTLSLARSHLRNNSFCHRTFEGTCGVISPDNRLAISGCHDGSLCLWDILDGVCIRKFGENISDRVYSIAVSPDGRWGLSGCRSRDSKVRHLQGTLLLSPQTFRVHDDLVCLWELSTGKCLRTFKGHSSEVESVTFSPDGRWGLSCENDAIRIWNLSTGQCIRTFDTLDKKVCCLAVTPDGRSVLSGGGDGVLRLWDLFTGLCLREFHGHNGWVKAVAIATNGRYALSGGHDQVVHLWDLPSAQHLRMFEGETDSIWSLAIAADGRQVLSGNRLALFRLWSLPDGRCLRTFHGQWEQTEFIQQATSTALSSDGKFALAASSAGRICLWGLQSGVVSDFIAVKPSDTHVILSREQKATAAISNAKKALQEQDFVGAIKAFAVARNVPGFERKRELLDSWAALSNSCTRRRLRGAWHSRTFEVHKDSVMSVAISKNSQLGLSGSSDSTLRLWDLPSGRCIRVFDGHTGVVNSVAFSYDGKFVLSASGERDRDRDNTVRLWQLSTGQCIKILTGHQFWVRSAVFSPADRYIVSGGDEGIRLWNVSSGHTMRTIKLTGGVANVAVSPDGQQVIANNLKTLCLWDASTNQLLGSLEGHSEIVRRMAVSPCGQWAVSSSGDKTIRVWDLFNGRYSRTLSGHTSHINTITISPDSRWVVSGSGGFSQDQDSTIRIWDLATGDCIRVLEGHHKPVRSVTISPNGRWLLSGSDDQTLRLWELDWEYEFPGLTDWDDRAQPFLEHFLTLRMPFGEDGFTRTGTPRWTDDDYQQLLTDLQYRGFGWLRPEGVRKKLEEMTDNWQGPPPLPWEK